MIVTCPKDALLLYGSLREFGSSILPAEPEFQRLSHSIIQYRKDGTMTGRPDIPPEKEKEVWTCAYCGQYFIDRRQFDNHSCRRND
jgi:hypothetical protein